ncbi:MAG TPA: VOC family protein, partial [Bradyrhizobium sp.]|nr:VOC family protein [Bradyrhizobium sp.]
MALKRMDNVGIAVDDLAATIDFFRELGLELEGRANSLHGFTSANRCA